ncbi:hypothetical protein [Mucilaginibacter sp.]|uniref:hypothetical protein n=1 Tax=Mucilaginibacter sp. TaxID=1882438 RepID=UPI0035BC585F
MKKLMLLILIGCSLIFIACHKTENSVSGVYVMHFKNEFSIATDTIIITAYNLAASTFQVERRDGYHRIREGKILAKEFKQEHWMATFDKEKQRLSESEFGKQIYLNITAGTLSFGGTYRKIK